jgi:phosphatidylglycerol lysyltransferase
MVSADPRLRRRLPHGVTSAGFRGGAAAALLAAWALIVAARPHLAPGLGHTPSGVLVAGSAVIGALAIGICLGQLLAWWMTAGVLVACLSAAALAPVHPWRADWMLVCAAVLLALAYPVHRGRVLIGPGRGLVIAGVAGQVLVMMLGAHGHAGPVPVPFVLGGHVAGAGVSRRPRGQCGMRRVGAVELERARAAHGRTHISCFVATADKRAVALPGGAVTAFRTLARSAICVGDPLAAPDDQPAAIAQLTEACARRGWEPCLYQTSPELRDAYRAAGLRLLKFGEEAIIDLRSFTLAVPERANLRREVYRADRAGLTATVTPWAAAEPLLRADLEPVSRAWLQPRTGREMGFSLGRFQETVDPGAWLVVVRGPGGSVHAFSSWLRLGSDGIALDLVRRHPQAGPGAVDLCLVEALFEARRRGMRIASLGAVPARDSANDAPDGRIAHAVRRRLYSRGLAGYRYESLARFKSKFAPRWESRDIAFSGGPSALRVLGALVAVHVVRRSS